MKWTVGLIDRYLLEKADEEVEKLKEQGKRIRCIWDGSVLEKAESEKWEGLCPVLSSKAKRRQRSKRGLVFNWPAPRPIRVMGMQWSAGLIAGMQGLPHLAVTRWWTTKGVFATKLRDVEEELLRVTVRKWVPCSCMCLTVAMLRDIGLRCWRSIGLVLSSVGSNIMSF